MANGPGRFRGGQQNSPSSERKGKTKTGSNITRAGSGAQKQLAAAEAAVTDRFGKVSQQKLQEEIAKGPKVKGLTSASGPVRQRFEKSPLGRLGIDPGLFGRSDLPTTNTQRTITASELANIGTERDRIANIRNKNARDLERLSQINQVLGLNRTSGMGIMDSLRQNFGGLQAQRDFANLGNTARGIANILPGRRLLTGLLNKIPGVNLPMQVGMSPVNFNITPEMRSFEQFSPLLSQEEQEQFSSPFLNRILFGSPADRAFQGPPITDGFQFSGMDAPIKLSDENKNLNLSGVGVSDEAMAAYNQFTDSPPQDVGKNSMVATMVENEDPYMQTLIDQYKDATGLSTDDAEFIASQAMIQNMLPGSGLFMTDLDEAFPVQNNSADTEMSFDDLRIFRGPEFEVGQNTITGGGFNPFEGVRSLFAPSPGFRIGQNTN